MDKAGLLKSLPFAIGDITVRPAVREDIDRRADWPSYEAPWDMFNAHAMAWDEGRREKAWLGMRDASPNDLHLACEGLGEELLAWYVVADIDWKKRAAATMTIRLHPRHLDQGLGTTLTKAILDWGHAQGLESIRLDVLATNLRAYRCYEKVGMKKIDSFVKYGVLFHLMESRLA